MNCSEVQALLSAYWGGELADDQRLRVTAHLDQCPDCARELTGFQELTAMSETLDAPAPPARIWADVAKQLDDARQEPVSAAGRVLSRLQSHRSRIVLAASVLMAVCVGYWGYSAWLASAGDSRFRAEISRYLDTFLRDSASAQQLLLAKYQGQSVAADEATREVGYRPLVADGLPESYSVQSINVMKMPCCTCVQFLCKRSAGGSIAIFEHDGEGTTDWFGNRVRMCANCCGKSCTLVQAGDGFAASWRRAERHITVVGMRDVNELVELVAWFDNRKRTEPQPD